MIYQKKIIKVFIFICVLFAKNLFAPDLTPVQTDLSNADLSLRTNRGIITSNLAFIGGVSVPDKSAYVQGFSKSAETEGRIQTDVKTAADNLKTAIDSYNRVKSTAEEKLSSLETAKDAFSSALRLAKDRIDAISNTALSPTLRADAQALLNGSGPGSYADILSKQTTLNTAKNEADSAMTNLANSSSGLSDVKIKYDAMMTEYNKSQLKSALQQRDTIQEQRDSALRERDTIQGERDSARALAANQQQTIQIGFGVLGGFSFLFLAGLVVSSVIAHKRGLMNDKNNSEESLDVASVVDEPNSGAPVRPSLARQRRVVPDQLARARVEEEERLPSVPQEDQLILPRRTVPSGASRAPQAAAAVHAAFDDAAPLRPSHPTEPARASGPERATSRQGQNPSRGRFPARRQTGT